MSESLTLYLDESGDQGWPDRPRATRYFVVAGLIVPPRTDLLLRDKIRRLILKHFGDDPWGPEGLHYNELIQKIGPYKGWTDAQCKRMADDVWGLIRGIDPLLMGTVVKKWVLKRLHKERAEQPLLYALRATLGRYDMHLETDDTVGYVILDSQNKSDVKRVHGLVTRCRRLGTGYTSRTPKARNRKLTRIVNTVAFFPDELSPGIQLADWISYATFSCFEYSNDERFNEVRSLWRKVGDFQEPSVIPRG